MANRPGVFRTMVLCPGILFGSGVQSPLSELALLYLRQELGAREHGVNLKGRGESRGEPGDERHQHRVVEPDQRPGGGPAEECGVGFWRAKTVEDHPLFIEMLVEFVADEVEDGGDE